jgi:hypothetical protein
MNARRLTVATALAIASICPLSAEENLVAYKSLTPELALDLARAALKSCRDGDTKWQSPWSIASA